VDSVQLPLARAGEATGAVVVIDVLRAFTTAAHAIDRGAAAIRLVRDVDEALALRDAGTVDLAMGEVDGLPIDGFDLSNSCAEIAAQDLGGARIAMRTTAGTRGAVMASGATRMLTGAFVTAGATADALRGEHQVTFLVTGDSLDRDGDEDYALADYVTALLQGPRPDPAPYLARVAASDHGRRFGVDLPAIDLDYARDLDRFDRALEIRREDGVPVIRPGT
jgi:2-phosphosulfolactate phosphatase